MRKNKVRGKGFFEMLGAPPPGSFPIICQVSEGEFSKKKNTLETMSSALTIEGVAENFPNSKEAMV